jgi:hypothetical protein
MPKQTGSTGLLGKYREQLKTAHTASANKPTEYGQMGLPPGIEGGVAQLEDCKIVRIKEGKKNAGEPMFFASGIVKRPLVHDGMRCAGERTQVMEPMFPTPGRTRQTFDDHLDCVYNELRKLGLKTEELDGSEESLVAAMTALQELKPHFKFRTWKGEKATEGPYAGKEPRTNHQWGGLVDFDEDDVSHVQSDPTPSASVNGAPVAADDEDDLDTLAELADGNDNKAKMRLNALALKAGLSQKKVDDADNWVHVVQLMSGKGGKKKAAAAEPAVSEDVSIDDEGTEVVEEEEEGDEIPKVGSVYGYFPIDKETKKPQKKKIDVSILDVDVAGKKVNAKNLTNSKVTYKGIKWDALKPPTDG